ncbi:MAG: GNAT family N-acetyltransferase [Alphaproteobacteria bacterium]|nr:GNAT family N-acetyltransferase [Alphaproteobacteria bacterium]
MHPLANTEWPHGAIRRLVPEDHALYREVRLRALATDPQVFGSTLERESALPDPHWRARLADPDFAIYGIFEGDAIVGMTGIAIRSDDPASANLWGSWLAPEARGRGLSRVMYRARLDWAVERGLARVTVSHRRSNVRSMQANQRFGFVLSHAAERTWPDGTVEDELFYALALNRPA